MDDVSQKPFLHKNDFKIIYLWNKSFTAHDVYKQANWFYS